MISALQAIVSRNTDPRETAVVRVCYIHAGKSDNVIPAEVEFGGTTRALSPEIAAGLEKEASAIIAKIPKGAWFCTLTPEGKVISSEGLADRMKEVKLSARFL